MQKFNKSRRIVEYSNPSGADEQQKINMAVAIHMKETNLMEYKYKDYDSMKWRFFKGWKILRNIPKFAMKFTEAATNSTKRGTEESETVSDTITTEESDTSSLGITEVGFNHDASRGGGKGKKVTMRKIEIEKETTRKRKRDETRDTHFLSLIDSISDIKEIMKQKNKVNILSMAIKATSDPTVKKRFVDKLLSAADNIDL